MRFSDLSSDVCASDLAVRIGVEGKAIGPMPLEQHHAHRGCAIRCSGGKRHGVRIVGFRCARLGKPLAEQSKRIASGDFTFVKHAVHSSAIASTARILHTLRSHGCEKVAPPGDNRPACPVYRSTRSEEHTADLQYLMRIS